MKEYSDFLQLAKDRYSVRDFSSKPVEPEKLEKILMAGQAAPTACNLQPQRILVIQDEEALQKMRKCTKCHFNAPLALLVCYDKEECWKREYDGKNSGDIDASIVATHMMMEAYSLGIGSTWVMYFIPEAVKEELKLPDTYEAVSLLVMGYPSENVKPHANHLNRKKREETVFYNSFE